MKMMIDKDTMEIVKEKGVFGVIEIEDEKRAAKTAEALLKGGISAIELTLRTEAAIPSLKIIHREFPEMFITAGTVLFPDQIPEVIDAGAAMGVAPGFNRDTVIRAAKEGFPFAPGVSTASEVEGAYSLGCNLLKIFPAQALGGVKYMKAMMGPYSYLGISLFPLGGITEENLGSWASEKNVVCVGGSWISAKNLINSGDYAEITRRALISMKIWKESRSTLS